MRISESQKRAMNQPHPISTGITNHTQIETGDSDLESSLDQGLTLLDRRLLQKKITRT